MSFRKKPDFSCLLILLAFGGHAISAEKVIDSGWGNLYLGIEIDQSTVDRTAICGRVGWTCDLKENSQKLLAGYEFNSFFSTEFGYMSYGDFELSGMGVNEVMTEVDTLFVNSFLAYPVFNWVSVFGKLGYNKWSSDSVLSDEEGLSDNKGYDVSYGLGMSFNFGQAIGIRTEWERLFLDEDESDSLTGSVFFRF